MHKKSKIKFNFKADFFFMFILSICIIELISWSFMKSPFNTQALNAVDFNIIYTEFSGFIPYIIIIIILCISFIFFPFFHKIQSIPRLLFLTNIIQITLSFIFLLTIFHDFHDKHNDSLFDASNNYFSILQVN